MTQDRFDEVLGWQAVSVLVLALLVPLVGIAVGVGWMVQAGSRFANGLAITVFGLVGLAGWTVAYLAAT